jgi:hypothetical protein
MFPKPNTLTTLVYDNDNCTRAFSAHTSFRPITTKADLDILLSTFPMVVLLGVFDWSNYSHDVVSEVSAEEQWFADHSIGLGLICLGDPAKLQVISPEAYSQFMAVTTEPVIFCFIKGSLSGVVSGPRSVADIERWLLQHAVAVHTPSSSDGAG